MQKKVLDNLFGGESISAYADGDHQGPAYYTIFSLQNLIKKYQKYDHYFVKGSAGGKFRTMRPSKKSKTEKSAGRFFFYRLFCFYRV